MISDVEEEDSVNIGIVKEIAAHGKEQRAILLPKEVRLVVKKGHSVFVERGLGERIFIADREYKETGARIVSNRRDLFNKDIVVKLKPPMPSEIALLGKNILFCMLHVEQNPEYVRALKRRSAKAIAMELIYNRAGERLIQCTDIAGEQGMLMAFHLAKKIPSECNVLVLGYGAIACGALKVAFGLGAKVKILRRAEFIHIKHFIRGKDIVVNGLSWPKEKREKKEYLITRKMLSLINKGGVILDLSVDLPNPVETCYPTLIDSPTYVVDDITHISIFGYPGLAPISSAKRYSEQVVKILLNIASAKKIENLPAYIRNAAIDPETYPI